MAQAFGIEFSRKTQSELVASIAGRRVPRGEGPRVLITTNLDHIGHLLENKAFRAAYDRAWEVTLDGMPVFIYAKLRGAAGPTRVPGSDLVSELLPELSPATDRVFFVAANWRTGRRLQVDLVSRGFRREHVTFTVPPFGFERDTTASRILAGRIRQHGTTHLFFGVGSPKSEVWLDKNRDQIGDCYALSVGAGLEFFAQTKRRAPVWMRKCGLEWSWRLGQEPRRLWRRYVVNSWRFLAAVGHDLTGSAPWATRH
jgi:N-acetylglucosaminyldiphosphoundecaprenol N-acetyl-beta-D-mannosaminyltransferase